MKRETDPKKHVEDLKNIMRGKGTVKSEEREKEKESPSELEALQKDLEAAQEEAKQNYDRALRAMADFDNYKKRIAKDLVERTQYGNEKLLGELLPVLDDLERVLAHLPKDSSEEAQTFVHGVELIKNQLLGVLQKFGVTPIESKGEPFDPSLHEAIAHVEDPTVPPGTVTEEHRRGYKIYDRLLRAAVVAVSKGGEKN